MKLNLIISALAVITLASCKTECILPIEETNSKLFPDNAKILLLGDSRVEGNRPDFESYRYELWKNLVDTDWTFDLIGYETDPASYDTYKGLTFDPDHMGFGGYMTGDIHSIVKRDIGNDFVPNIVLLGIGGNDLLGEVSANKAIKNIKKTIEILQCNNPNVIIFIEQIAPARSDIMTEDKMRLLEDFTGQIISLATEQSNVNSFIIPVDMQTGWTDDYMVDESHYNTEGAAFIADRYSTAMDAFFEN
ncbi:MAG: hypothetical protein ACI8ZM_002538 [Crocinitomix sp.]|jgi:hypothetical protein